MTERMVQLQQLQKSKVSTQVRTVQNSIEVRAQKDRIRQSIEQSK